MAYQISLACPRPQTAARETLNLHTVHSAPETADNAVLRLHEADAAANLSKEPPYYTAESYANVRQHPKNSPLRTELAFMKLSDLRKKKRAEGETIMMQWMRRMMRPIQKQRWWSSSLLQRWHLHLRGQVWSSSHAKRKRRRGPQQAENSNL